MNENSALSRRAGRRIICPRKSSNRQNCDGEMTLVPQSHRLQCVILAARGFVTADALVWLAREHVAVFVVWEGEFLTVVSAAAGQLARQELAVRRRQMECVLDPARRLIAARALVEAKIGTLKLEPAERQMFAGKAARAREVQDARLRRAGGHWRGWKGGRRPFPGCRQDLPECN